MAARYARFITSFWRDPDLRALPPLVKLAYIWAFSNEACRISGMYLMDEDMARSQTGMTRRQWKSAWQTLLAYEKKGGGNLIRYDDETGVVWVVGRFKQETSTAPGVEPSRQTVVGGWREVHDLPNTLLREAFHRKYASLLRGPIGGPGGVSDHSTSTSTKPTPNRRESKHRGSSKNRRTSGRRQAADLSQGGRASGPDGIDSSPAAIKEATEILRGLSKMGAGKDANQIILELKPIGVYEQTRLGIFEHPDRDRCKRELRRAFSADLADSIYIRRPER